MELKDYLLLIRRWLWLLCLGLILGAIVGVVLTWLQSPIYQASTRIMVIRPPKDNGNEFSGLTDQQLVQTYIQLLSTTPVLEEASRRLGYDVNSNQISIQRIPDTNTIQITVVDEIPEHTSGVANVLIQVLVEQSEKITAGQYEETEESLEAQIGKIEGQILQLQSQHTDFSDGTQQQQEMMVYQQLYASLLSNLEQIRLARLQNTPNIVQIEPAVVPANPIQTRPVKNIGFSAVIGLFLAGGIAFLIEYVDDTIRTPEDVEHLLELPVIGYIMNMTDPGDKEKKSDEIHVINNPRSPISEAFRSLRTNLEFTNVDSTLSKILITSPSKGEGKTTVSANLAAIIAQSGKRVVLIDADLRKPRVHSVFGIPNRVGLSTLFRGDLPVKSVVQPYIDTLPLYIITSGELPPNPTELLASAKMDQILSEASREFDVIILDSSPSLVTDFQVLSRKVDGTVLIIQPGLTQADMACGALEQLQRVNAKILGVVLNKVPRESHYYGKYYGGYYHYSHYGDALPEVKEPQLPGTSQKMNLLPGDQSDRYYIQEEGLEQFYNSDLPQGYVSMYVPPKEAPASHNVITRPRKNQDRLQVKTGDIIEKPSTANPGIYTWYLGQDDEGDEQGGDFS